MATVEERFWSRVTKVKGGCWYWTGTVNKDGYGVIGIKSKSYLAHRVSFELSGRLLSPELVLDHKCRTRNCVRPKHLRQVTRSKNSRRKQVPRKVMLTCKRGHPRIPENLYVPPARPHYVQCRICKKQTRRATRITGTAK